jgi:O-antigen ligase
MAALLLVATTVAADRGLAGLALALLVSAAFQGFYGLLVLTSDDPHIWQSPKLHYLDSATGTFVNRNHFACFLAMGLTCGLALLLRNARRVRASGRRNLVLQTLSGDNGRNVLLVLLFVIGLAGLLASLSRAGIFLGLGGLALTLLVAGRPRGIRTRLIVAALILLAAALPLLQLGAERHADRYARSTTDLLAAGGRAVVWGDTLSMAAAFPLAGTGFGTFAAAYPLFRSPEVRLFYSHAHNDLLQLASEAGILGLACLALLLRPVVTSIVRGLAGAAGSLAVGLAAGLLVALIHSLVDFNFHIPANGATAAILAGGLLGVTCAGRASS